MAALSGTSASGFTVSGCWRQQFDWAVVEWNRDNVFEHPALRNLPDGDLSGVHAQLPGNPHELHPHGFDALSTRGVAVPENLGGDPAAPRTLHGVPLKNYATGDGRRLHARRRCSSRYRARQTAGDYIELAWLDQHFNYRLRRATRWRARLAALAGAIDQFAGGSVTAAANGAAITLTYAAEAGLEREPGRSVRNGARRGNGDVVAGVGDVQRRGVAAAVAGEPGFRQPDWTLMATRVPTTNVRKLRWTWAADLQPGNFQRSEFSVAVTNWPVTGSDLLYNVAGPGSRRIEDDAPEIAYSAANQWS